MKCSLPSVRKRGRPEEFRALKAISIYLFFTLPYICVGANTIFVTTTNDSGSNSLRAALSSANTLGGAEIIITNIDGPILISSELPQIEGTVSIRAAGTNMVTISSGEKSRVFKVGTGAICGLYGLVLERNRTTNLPGGGAVLNLGELTVSNCVIRQNSVGPRMLYDYAPFAPNFGGGICSVGRLTLVDSIVSSNWVRGGVGGLNSHLGAGGGIHCQGSALISNSFVFGNAAYGGDGSYVSAYNPPGNGGPAFGGGLTFSNCTASVVNTTIASNVADGGNPGTNPRFTGSPGYSLGGGIGVAAADVDLWNCTLSGNVAKGDGRGDGGNMVVLSNQTSTTRLLGCTVVNGSGFRGSQLSASNRLELLSTIVGADVAARKDVWGRVVSLGHNLFAGQPPATVLLQPSDLHGVPSLLGELQLNGGFAPCHIPLAGSPVLDAGINNGQSTDQRGLTRTVDQLSYSNSPSGDGTDIGAAEQSQFAGRPPITTNFVNNLNDVGSGTLRSGITNANAAGGGVVIVPAGYLALQSGLPTMLAGVELRGPGPEFLTIEGNHLPMFSGAGKISGVHLSQGEPAVSGDFTVVNCAITGSTNLHAVSSARSLVMRNCTVSNNVSGERRVFVPDTADWIDWSPVAIRGSAEIIDCVFRNNRTLSSGGGGAIGVGFGKALVDRCYFAENVAYDEFGGAIYSAYNATTIVTSCIFERNHAQSGGAIYGSSYAITNCEFYTNTTTGYGGAAEVYDSIIASSTFIGNASSGVGGAILGTTTALLNCTMYNNSAAFGGAVSILDSMVIANCTLSTNTASKKGGAVHVSKYYTPDVTIMHCTIVGNHALEEGGGVINDSTTAVIVANSILADNVASNVLNDAQGLIRSGGFNLIGTSNGFATLAGTDRAGIPMHLSGLRYNGGPTLTHAPLSGSPAIDGGTNLGLAFDQRGRPRTVDQSTIANAQGGDGTDVGAVEVDKWMIGATARRVGNDIRISFLSQTEVVYRVEFAADIHFTQRMILPGIVPGTGSVLSHMHTNGAFFGQGFYRVIEW